MPSATPYIGYKFATYQRGGGGLDYAMNRHYSPVYGRFTSADPYRASAGPSDPGSWNRYAYVQGDPVNFNDPTGLARCWVAAWRRDEGGPAAQVHCASEGGTHAEVRWVPTRDIPSPGNTGGSLTDQVIADAESSWGGSLDSSETADLISKGTAVLSALARRVFTADCEEWLLSRLGISMDDLKRGARSATLHNGLQRTAAYASLYANTPAASAAARDFPESIAEYMRNRRNVSALAELNGSNIYLSPSAVSSYGTGFLEATLFHELLHNITGKADDAIQRALGIAVTTSTVNITYEVIKRCY